jgi:hypothetical protein
VINIVYFAANTLSGLFLNLEIIDYSSN